VNGRLWSRAAAVRSSSVTPSRTFSASVPLPDFGHSFTSIVRPLSSALIELIQGKVEWRADVPAWRAACYQTVMRRSIGAHRKSLVSIPWQRLAKVMLICISAPAVAFAPQAGTGRTAQPIRPAEREINAMMELVSQVRRCGFTFEGGAQQPNPQGPKLRIRFEVDASGNLDAAPTATLVKAGEADVRLVEEYKKRAVRLIERCAPYPLLAEMPSARLASGSYSATVRYPVQP